MEGNFICRLKYIIQNLKIKSNTKGITMIALVVTIIVLLIIAGVSIGSLQGSDGILNKASAVNQVYEREKAKTRLELTLKDALMLKYSTEGLTEAKLNQMLSELGTVNGDEVTIDGYTYKIDRKKLEIID